MRVGFDLDGVICDVNLALLRAIADDRPAEELYYRTRRALLNPFQWLGPEDSGLIVTHRKLWTKEITRAWLVRNGIYQFFLCFSREALPPGVGSGEMDGPWAPFSAALAKSKYLSNADIYIDDDTDEALALRQFLKNDCKVLIYGGSV